MAVYSIDREEAKNGEDILRGVLGTITEEMGQYSIGNQSYGDMLYRIGEKLAIAGGALYSENRYQDKEERAGKYRGECKELADFDKFADDFIEQMGW